MCMVVVDTITLGIKNVQFYRTLDLLNRVYPLLKTSAIDADTLSLVLHGFLLTVKAAPHECVIRTSQP